MLPGEFHYQRTLCGITAYKYYRTPPRYLGVCPPLPECDVKGHYHEMHEAPLATEILGFPLHALTDSAAHRSQSNTVTYHVVSCELPFWSIRDTDHGFKLASPEFTLFTLSRSLTFNQLVMAMYEMCGRFSLFEPTRRLQRELEARGTWQNNDGWSRVSDQAGRPTDLWTRPPLTTTSDLSAFAESIRGIRGAKLFSRAIDCVSGMVASPLEAQLSMLVWMNPELGGWGYRHIENNYSVAVAKTAKALIDQQSVEIDMRVLSPDRTREWMIECQGKAVHDRIGAGTKDSMRSTALQAMGYGVTMVTSKQIADPEGFAALLDILSRELGMQWGEKSNKQLLAENRLRSEIFCDWSTLADEPSKQELERRYAENRAQRASGAFPKRKKRPKGSRA